MGRPKQEGYQFPRNVLSRRRAELGLSITEAADKIGVHPRTWKSYETGAPVPLKQLTNIMTAMEWFSAGIYVEDTLEDFVKAHDWSEQIAETYGNPAAICFALGSEALRQAIQNDSKLLSKIRGRNPHIGHLGKRSELRRLLPEMFMNRYNKIFLADLDNTLTALITRATGAEIFLAHTVLEEITIYAIACLAKTLYTEFDCAKLCPPIADYDDDDDGEVAGYGSDVETWAFDVFGDMDIVTILYSPFCDDIMDEESDYYFDNWKNPAFYVDD